MSDGIDALFKDFFGGSTARTVALLIGADYRGVAPGELRVRFKRRALCGVCAGQGCDNCDRVGWAVRAESVEVPVRRDTEVGTRMRLAGTDDEVSRTLHTEILVEIVEEGPRADELLRAQRAYEQALEGRYALERREKLAAHRMAKMMLRLGGLFLVVVAGWWAKEYFDKRLPGGPCAVDSDCRSHQCLTLRTSHDTGIKGLPPIETTQGRVCTLKCATDADCPSTMRCAGVHVGAATRFVFSREPEHDNALACVPR